MGRNWMGNAAAAAGGSPRRRRSSSYRAAWRNASTSSASTAQKRRERPLPRCYVPLPLTEATWAGGRRPWCVDDREDELGCRALGIDGQPDGTALRRGLLFPNASSQALVIDQWNRRWWGRGRLVHQWPASVWTQEWPSSSASTSPICLP